MGRDNGQGPLNTLKPQPGQTPYAERTYHPLPGEWAKQQLLTHPQLHQTSGSSISSAHYQTELQKALAAERQQHEYWEEWQGIKPGKPVYEDPRAFQNTLLPTARYGTEGRGYG